MRKGKCKLKDSTLFSFKTLDGGYAELGFGKNTVFEFEECNKNCLLTRKRIGLYIPKSDFKKLTIVLEEQQPLNME